MAHHDQQGRLQMLDPILDSANLATARAITSYADNEEIAHATIKDALDGNA